MAVVSADHGAQAAHGEGQLQPPAAALEEAEQRVQQLEEELTKLSTELAMARGVGAGDAELKRRAEEAYTGINDALSELRTNILLARDLAGQHQSTPDLTEAIQVSIDRAEDAKGMLRWLREVIE
jgi:hypothetical protein